MKLNCHNLSTSYPFCRHYFIDIIKPVALRYRQSCYRVVGLHSYRMEVMLMKNHFDFKDILTFGLFLLALLTFVFTFCK